RRVVHGPGAHGARAGARRRGHRAGPGASRVRGADSLPPRDEGDHHEPGVRAPQGFGRAALIPIPGVVIAVLTFPGVIVHEAAHLIFCRLAGLAVFAVCFFRIGNPAGYVIHEPPATYRASFAVSMGPFLVNSVLCVAFCSAGLLPVWELKLPD